MEESNELNTNFNYFDEISELESVATIDNSVFEQKATKLEFIEMLKRENLSEVLKKLPERNISYHIVSNGTFDFFTFIPTIVEMLGKRCNEFYGSIWTMNRNNVVTIEQYSTLQRQPR